MKGEDPFGQARAPGERRSFLLFWAGVSAAWTAAWLLVDFALVPEATRVAPSRLGAIGIITALLPAAVFLFGRAALWLASRTMAKLGRKRAPWRSPAAAGEGRHARRAT